MYKNLYNAGSFLSINTFSLYGGKHSAQLSSLINTKIISLPISAKEKQFCINAIARVGVLIKDTYLQVNFTWRFGIKSALHKTAFEKCKASTFLDLYSQEKWQAQINHSPFMS